MNTNFILGLDLYPINEAARRAYYANKANIPIAILRYDTSENISDDSGLTGTDNEKMHSKIVLGILYNTIRKVPSRYRSINMKYKGLASSKFNLINCQFSLHYYFKNEITLNQYLQNISDKCAQGG